MGSPSRTRLGTIYGLYSASPSVPIGDYTSPVSVSRKLFVRKGLKKTLFRAAYSRYGSKVAVGAAVAVGARYAYRKYKSRRKAYTPKRRR